MNFPVQQLRLPDLGPGADRWQVNLQRELLQWTTAVTQLLNNSVQGLGPQIDIDDPTNDALVPSVNGSNEATITPSHAIHPIVGTTNTLGTISVPYRNSVTAAGAATTVPYHTGPIFLIPKEIVVTDLNGNIGLATTMVVNKLLILLYDGVSWYPHDV